jgi:riboflavin kinase/FMN adenylyltransferase
MGTLVLNAIDAYAAAAGKSSALCLGNFDGVHLGHAHLLRRLVRIAGERSLLSVVLTFEPHPLEVLGKSRVGRLTSPAQKVRLLEAAGVDVVVVQPFTASFASLSPDGFMREVIATRLMARVVVVGPDVRFGAGGAGDARQLETFGRSRGIDVHAIEALRVEGRPVSSSFIRSLLERGEAASVRRMLGRPYRMEGSVVPGDGRGSALGYPTANLSRIDVLVPKDGVYAGAAESEGDLHPAAIHIGRRPTFDAPFSVEVHIIGRRSDAPMAGRRLAVHLLERLRDSARCPDTQSLREKIREDIDRTARIYDTLTHVGLAGKPEASAMKRHLLDRIPESLLRRLAKERGYLARPGQSIDEIKAWLMVHYRRGVEEIMEKGGDALDAASEALRRVRSVMGIPTQEQLDTETPTPPSAPSDAFSTATMAKIYEGQGLLAEAIAIYEKLLEKSPDSPAWKKQIDRLKKAAAGAGVSTPKASAPSVGATTVAAAHVTRPEPMSLLDIEELPEGYGQDTMILLAVGPADLYATWEITHRSLEAGVQEAGSRDLVLRLYEVAFTEEGLAQVTIRDEVVLEPRGEHFIHHVRPGGFYRAAVGLRAGGAFVPLVHSGLEATPQEQAPASREEEWMEVDPRPLLWRTRDLQPLVVPRTSRLSLRDMALLRLHMLGREDGSRLSGISGERLAVLFGPLRDLQAGAARVEISSFPWEKK